MQFLPFVNFNRSAAFGRRIKLIELFFGYRFEFLTLGKG